MPSWLRVPSVVIESSHVVVLAADLSSTAARGKVLVIGDLTRKETDALSRDRTLVR
jgi:hypothetical protein